MNKRSGMSNTHEQALLPGCVCTGITTVCTKTGVHRDNSTKVVTELLQTHERMKRVVDTGETKGM